MSLDDVGMLGSWEVRKLGSWEVGRIDGKLMGGYVVEVSHARRSGEVGGLFLLKE